MTNIISLSVKTKEWPKINKRLTNLKEEKPDAEIICYGLSLGGAASTLTEKYDTSTYIIVNAFSSLSLLLWHEY
jgi:esterase/lipase